MATILPNPFQFETVTPVSDSAAASSPCPHSDAAASPFTDSTLGPARAVEAAAAPGLTDPPVAAADNFPRGFDPDRFYESIEPLPLFLQAHNASVLEILARY